MWQFKAKDLSNITNILLTTQPSTKVLFVFLKTGYMTCRLTFQETELYKTYWYSFEHVTVYHILLIIFLSNWFTHQIIPTVSKLIQYFDNTIQNVQIYKDILNWSKKRKCLNILRFGFLFKWCKSISCSWSDKWELELDICRVSGFNISTLFFLSFDISLARRYISASCTAAFPFLH